MNAIHHAAAEGYTARADTYAKGRPEYPSELESWLHEELRLCPGRHVLDLGAGTGKFSSRLLATGAEVIALEPVAAMRDQLRERCPQVKIYDGSAEAIPLPDSSVDAVVCAQSFHWFATPAALREIHRVLKPAGLLGLIWNVRDESIPWVAALSQIIEPFAGDAPRYWKQTWRTLFPFPGFADLREHHLPNAHQGSPEEVIVARTLSVSFIAALPVTEQEKIATQVRALIAATPELAGQETVTFPYETVAFSCAKLDEPTA